MLYLLTYSLQARSLLGTLSDHMGCSNTLELFELHMLECVNVVVFLLAAVSMRLQDGLAQTYTRHCSLLLLLQFIYLSVHCRPGHFWVLCRMQWVAATFQSCLSFICLVCCHR